jgi:hypothetical protein
MGDHLTSLQVSRNGATTRLSLPKRVHSLHCSQYLRGKSSGGTLNLLTLPAQIFYACLPTGGKDYYCIQEVLLFQNPDNKKGI